MDSGDEEEQERRVLKLRARDLAFDPSVVREKANIVGYGLMQVAVPE